MAETWFRQFHDQPAENGDFVLSAYRRNIIQHGHVDHISARHLFGDNVDIDTFFPFYGNEVGRGRLVGKEFNDAIERLKKDCGFHYEGRELGTCSVCLEELSGDLIRVPSCSHHYHVACVVSWLEKKNSCPLCRGKVL